MKKRSKPKKVKSGRVPFGNVELVKGRKRQQTRVTPTIIKIARRFPGKNAATVKEIANFIFRSTPVRDTVESGGKHFRRTPKETLERRSIGLLHCYERSHSLISVLSAKEISSWMVLELDWQNFAHTYVETSIGNKIYTVAFRTYDPPIIREGQTETTLQHSSGSTFVRGLDMGDLGVRNGTGFKRLVERINTGKEKGSIFLK